MNKLKPYSASERKKQIESALVRMITEDLKPASTVKRPGFLNLLKVHDPKYACPDRRTIMRKFLPKSSQEKKAISTTEAAEAKVLLGDDRLLNI